MRYIEDIYFFEVNTKYISSSAVKKISIFHECVARVKMLIFSPHSMKYIWYSPQKSKFSLYFILIMFDVDVTTCVALFLTNILHLKPYVKKSQSQNCQESLVLLQFYSILQ